MSFAPLNRLLRSEGGVYTVYRNSPRLATPDNGVGELLTDARLRLTQQTFNGFSWEIKQHTAATTILFYGYKLYVLYMYMSEALKVRSILLIFFFFNDVV